MKYHGVQFTRLMPRNELAANIIMEYCPGKATAARALAMCSWLGAPAKDRGAAHHCSILFATTGGDLEQFCTEHGLCTLDDTTRWAYSGFPASFYCHCVIFMLHIAFQLHIRTDGHERFSKASTSCTTCRSFTSTSSPTTSSWIFVNRDMSR